MRCAARSSFRAGGRSGNGFGLGLGLDARILRRGSGRIVTVASTAGLVGAKYTAAYTASKHAAVGLTRAVAAEILQLRLEQARLHGYSSYADFALSDTMARSQAAVTSLLEQVWRLPRSESDFVTVYVPELFAKGSLLEQVKRPRELALKFRLLAEPGVVVTDIPVLADRPACRART